MEELRRALRRGVRELAAAPAAPLDHEADGPRNGECGVGASTAADIADSADGRAGRSAKKKRPRSALLLGARPHREVRLLTEQPPNTVIHATFFLRVRGLGALDMTCQRFHPVGLTQKACLMRAGMWLPRAESARVERPAQCWPQWLDEVRFRGRQRRRRYGRMAAGALGGYEDTFAMVVRDDGSVNATGVMQDEDGEVLLELSTVQIALQGRRVTQVSSRYTHALVLLDSGEVLSFGCGAQGRVGHGDQQHQRAPKVIEALQGRRVVQVSSGDLHSLVRLEGGEVLSFGWGRYGSLGHGDKEVEIEKGENEVAPMTSEERAIRDVPARWPERLRLRALLDDVFGSSSQEAVDIDLQRVRRLVSALVNRTGRHTIHPKGKPKLGVHPCARGKEPNPFCRYGFPHPCVQRGGERPMRLERGEKEAPWFARFARNDELCCNYEAHVLLANMGNVDWRPCLNLWAVVQYVTKYATKAPKGSRRLHDPLKDSVDEVCTYLPEGEGNDFLRRSIQKFFARTMGERDFHAFEAVQLGLQLPLVMPLMPVVSLNTSGSRPLKSWSVLQSAGPNEPVHYDSRVDKFNKRLQFVRRQCTGEELN